MSAWVPSVVQRQCLIRICVMCSSAETCWNMIYSQPGVPKHECRKAQQLAACRDTSNRAVRAAATHSAGSRLLFTRQTVASI